MRFIYAFAAEGQSLPAKLHGADEGCVAVRYAWWKMIFNYGSDQGLLRPPGWINVESVGRSGVGRRFFVLEKGINKRRHGRAFSHQQQDAEQEHNDDYRQQPELFSDSEEFPKLS
jgi:hypothetical protein